MLEERERKQAGDWSKLKRWSTRIVLAFIAVVAVVFFGTGLHKDLAAAMSGEPAPPAARKGRTAPVVPAIPAAGPSESVETVLKQSSGYDPAPAKAKPGNGKLIDQDDIRFTMQLMDFMQGKSKHDPRPAAAAKPKDGQ